MRYALFSQMRVFRETSMLKIKLLFSPSNNQIGMYTVLIVNFTARCMYSFGTTESESETSNMVKNKSVYVAWCWESSMRCHLKSPRDAGVHFTIKSRGAHLRLDSVGIICHPTNT